MNLNNPENKKVLFDYTLAYVVGTCDRKYFAKMWRIFKGTFITRMPVDIRRVYDDFSKTLSQCWRPHFKPVQKPNWQVSSFKFNNS